ncbi:hypothetical protein [Flavihumibacter profundi]|uniref:hypothetical protein n=1 Tax=Flavihumibacter profundi TaxID=2716883 RepID=UPI001CC7CE35|nr:hypothetical protein [Flavihumibacter profundi]MBZ5859443.1 hypothetical protein [Flavihumibacter profundi]
MAIRSNSYDTMGENLEMITEIKNHHNNILQKGVTNETPTEFIESVALDQKAVNTLCREVNLQFEQLKSDYENRRIIQAFYVDHLKKLKEFLTNRENTFDNKHLDTASIAVEIQKFV